MEKTVTIEIPVEYKRLFDNDWREAAIYGGRYSLKSHTIARYLLIEARLKKTRIACFREFQNSIAESSHQLLADLIRLYKLNDFEITNNSIINKINGSLDDALGWAQKTWEDYKTRQALKYTKILEDRKYNSELLKMQEIK